MTTYGFEGFLPHSRPSRGNVTRFIISLFDRVEDSGIEPLTSCMPFRDTRVLSDTLSEVAATADSRCTTCCTSEPLKRRKRVADAASVGGVGTPAEVKPEPVETDFAAALKMLALLPLSDEDRAEAVRRLLRERG